MPVTGRTILWENLLVTYPPPPIITIPITLIGMATITIPIRKDMWKGMNTRAVCTGGRADIRAGAAPQAGGAGTKIRRLPGLRFPRGIKGQITHSFPDHNKNCLNGRGEEPEGPALQICRVRTKRGSAAWQGRRPLFNFDVWLRPALTGTGCKAASGLVSAPPGAS